MFLTLELHLSETDRLFQAPSWMACLTDQNVKADMTFNNFARHLSLLQAKLCPLFDCESCFSKF